MPPVLEQAPHRRNGADALEVLRALARQREHGAVPDAIHIGLERELKRLGLHQQDLQAVLPKLRLGKLDDLYVAVALLWFVPDRRFTRGASA